MQFVVRLGTPEGRVFEETRSASDEASLKRELEKGGYHIFEVRPKGLGRLSLGLSRGPRRIPVQEFLIFNQEIAALLRSGLPLLQALELMLERMAQGAFRPVLTDIRDRVRSGEDLSEAFAAHGELFPRLYPASLKAGEKSGELENVIRRFIRYQKLMLDARKRVISAMVYPSVLFSTSVVMVLVLTGYVMPRFTKFYDDLGQELPILTRITLAFSNFLTRHWPWLLVAVVGGVIGLRYWSRTAQGRYALDAFKLRLPLLGPILHRLALSEFTRSLSTLLAGGIPLVPAFELACGAVGNAAVRERLAPQIQLVREGKAFHEALEKSGVVVPLAIDMVKVGETTGELHQMLGDVSVFFDEQVETQVQRILSLLEPIMLVFMGVIVALILVSLYLPMFSMIGGGGEF
jgi:type IV pilus assembly protein PilC